MANEALSIDLTDPDVADAFAEAEVGDQCVIKATVLSKDEEGIKASLDSAEYNGYTYTVNDDSEEESSMPGRKMGPKMNSMDHEREMGGAGPAKRGKGLVVMVGIGKPKK